MAETLSRGRIFALLVALSVQMGCSRHQQPAVLVASKWNPGQAAAYLDQREAWWMQWPGAKRDQGTFCVSCHTPLPYILARPLLRSQLGETGPSPHEAQLVANVKRRVRLWNEIAPFYTDALNGSGKTAQSWGTEAVLNALILTSVSVQSGGLDDDARAALGHMWALQQKTGDNRGTWKWLQFGNEPWEAKDSGFYGAALAAIATGIAPNGYGHDPLIAGNLELLRGYLSREYVRQPLMNQVVLLWAAAKLPGLLSARQQSTIIRQVTDEQRPDGGWRLASMAWTWKRNNFRPMIKMWLLSEANVMNFHSDGYATGLTAYILEQNGMGQSDVRVQRALDWLRHNQDPSTGSWPSYSLNHRRGPYSETGRFMSDAATAFAVLALIGGSPSPALKTNAEGENQCRKLKKVWSQPHPAKVKKLTDPKSEAWFNQASLRKPATQESSTISPDFLQGISDSSKHHRGRDTETLNQNKDR